MLVDEGSFVDVMFWEAFINLGIPMESLEPYDGDLVLKSRNHIVY